MYFSPGSPLMGVLWGTHTHTHTHRSPYNTHAYTHIPLTVYRPRLPSSPPPDILLLPSEGSISRPSPSTRSPGSRSAPAHLAPPCSGPFSPCHHVAWLREAQKLDSFYPQTEGLWWEWARGTEPWPEKETQPLSAFTGGLP